MIVGLIPARGGSKGIPKKNLSKLSDKNLIEIGIDKLLKAGCNNVYVSTENSEISEIALKSGAKLIFRPHEFATDESSTEEVIFHAIKYLDLNDDDLLVTHDQELIEYADYVIEIRDGGRFFSGTVENYKNKK